MEEFILSRFGMEMGGTIIADIGKRRLALERFCMGKSASQENTMKTAILPRIALYQSLQEIMPAREAYDVTWTYTRTVVCPPKNRQYLKMERIPGFYHLFKRIFLFSMSHSENWRTKPGPPSRDGFGFTIHKCLWYDTCAECGCPELCKIFCDSDWENFRGLSKIQFKRTESLGTGGELCDFHFEKKHK